jgi:hypothetical protein
MVTRPARRDILANRRLPGGAAVFLPQERAGCPPSPEAAIVVLVGGSALVVGSVRSIVDRHCAEHGCRKPIGASRLSPPRP